VSKHITGYGPNGAPIYGETSEDDTPPVVNMTGRTPPEVRERILEMFKSANSKYAKPFEKDRLAWASVLGGNWEQYGAIVLQVAILDTLLSIEEKLDQLADKPKD
jgi:hypothetical protein